MLILMTGYGFLFHGADAASGLGMWSIFPSRHHLSAILTTLLPLLISLAVGIQDVGRRLIAIAAAVWCGIGLLLCLERSAWIGVAVGLVVWRLAQTLTPGTAPMRRSWRPALAVLLTGVVVAIGFFSVTGVHALVADRARDLSKAVRGQDRSFSWRVQKWEGTAAMVAKRPAWGWGTGQYVLRQAAFTRLGRSQAEVLRDGPSFDEMAYNEYLQTAAELGLPGLALYLLVLASFFSKAGHALRRLPNGLRQTIVLGCMGGIAAQMVDAAANGSWRYAECSIFFWLVLGLGTAVVRMAYQAPPSRRYVPE
jgi:putative inorganic carbon (HCO3(-)) transporter